MYILLSPAKSLDYTREHELNAVGQIASFMEKTAQLHEVLRAYSASELEQLFHVSPKIAELNYNRFRDWSTDFSSQSLEGGEYPFLPAILAFTGDVYRSFDLSLLTCVKKEVYDRRVGILSGYYGILRPFDFMKPYRLEMGTRMSFDIAGDHYGNLYDFWRSHVSTAVERHAGKDGVINLASQEYSKVVDREVISGPFVDVDFKVDKNGALKTIGIYAKKARGLMAQWLVENDCMDVTSASAFAEDGWHYSEDDSGVHKMVFIKKV